MALNGSTSKQKYSFSRSSRFANVPLPTHVTQYDNSDTWKKWKGKPINKEFTKTQRFKYYADEKRHRAEHPSPDHYKVNGQFGVERDVGQGGQNSQFGNNT